MFQFSFNTNKETGPFPLSYSPSLQLDLAIIKNFVGVSLQPTKTTAVPQLWFNNTHHGRWQNGDWTGSFGELRGLDCTDLLTELLGNESGMVITCRDVLFTLKNSFRGLYNRD